MDPVFDAQFDVLQRTFAQDGRQIEVAYRPDGTVDYLYEAARILCDTNPDRGDVLRRALPGIRRMDEEPGRLGEGLELWTLEDLDDGFRTVPEALDVIDDVLGEENPARRGERPIFTPNHVVHITRICPAVEPEVPFGNPAGPSPAQRPPGQPARAVRIGVSDTGHLQNLPPAQYPWLANVAGDPDPLGPAVPGGQASIPPFAGHGTFVAGVAACFAPDAEIRVNDHFSLSGGELESAMVAKLDQLAQGNSDIINLSAGTYTRNNWLSLGFDTWHDRHPGIVLVAAAGNESTSRRFYPAAFPWVIGVGALGPDQVHRAWFSNHGPWVDVYALGEGMVNAYATGEYTYKEPPKRPAKQNFSGMARWDGTSFSAPMVAGLIGARMARENESAEVAAAGVLAFAQGAALPGGRPRLLIDAVP